MERRNSTGSFLGLSFHICKIWIITVSSLPCYFPEKDNPYTEYETSEMLHKTIVIITYTLVSDTVLRQEESFRWEHRMISSSSFAYYIILYLQMWGWHEFSGCIFSLRLNGKLEVGAVLTISGPSSTAWLPINVDVFCTLVITTLHDCTVYLNSNISLPGRTVLVCSCMAIQAFYVILW